MHRIIFFILSLLFVASNIMADNTVSGTFVGPSTDNQWTLDVNLTNDSSYTAFQLDIKLPAGLSVMSATPVSSRLSSFVITHNLIREKDNTVRVTAYNLSNNAISGASGSAVVRLLLQADEEVADSAMSASFYNVDFIGATSMDDNELSATNGTTGLLNKYLKITAQEEGTTRFNQYGQDGVSATLEYATATQGWQDYTYGTDISLTQGNSVWFRAKGTLDQLTNQYDGKNSTLNSNDNYLMLYSTADIAASQNIMSLLDASCSQTDVPEYAFSKLFYECKHLRQAPELPATTLANACYSSMFYGCTSLTSLPDFSSATVASEASTACKDMFSGCTSLMVNTIGPGTEWKTPSFDATLSSNFSDMFAGTAGNFTGSPESGVTYYVADKPYTRSMDNEWGTIVLPFDVTISDTNPYDFYTLTGVSASALLLTKMTEKLPAGTPAIIRMGEATKNSDTGKYELSLTANMAYSTTINTPDAVDGLTLTGTYTSKDITSENGYIIDNGTFWNIADVKGDDNVYCEPFHAYLAGAVFSGAKQLDINTDDIITGVNSIPMGEDWDESSVYDLNGRRINNPQSGVNIVRFRNGSTKKVIIK